MLSVLLFSLIFLVANEQLVFIKPGRSTVSSCELCSSYRKWSLALLWLWLEGWNWHTGYKILENQFHPVSSHLNCLNEQSWLLQNLFTARNPFQLSCKVRGSNSDFLHRSKWSVKPQIGTAYHLQWAIYLMEFPAAMIVYGLEQKWHPFAATQSV